jgi:predicted dehydrogenase
LFDLGVYNVTSLCGFLGSAQRVTALVGTAIPERIVDGAPVKVAADDNAHVLIDFGNQVFASVTTGFTIQKYGRAPAIELYGLEGTMNMLGDDWAPRGYEVWRNSHGAWEVFDETEPSWPWAYGIIHLVDCLEKGEPALTRPEQAHHALEIMRAAMRSAEEGRAVDIDSSFPEPRFRGPSVMDGRAAHDPT